MNSVQTQSHELLSHACGVLFCIGLWTMVVGQVLQNELAALEVTLLAMLMVVSVMLAWQSIRGLVAALKVENDFDETTSRQQ